MSIDGYNYYPKIFYHYTHYVLFYPLKLKSHVAATFIKFKFLVENQFRHHIGTFYTDNRGELKVLQTFLEENGITHLTTPPHSAEHNKMAERRHIHLVETGLAFLTHSSMSVSYYTCFSYNRLPHQKYRSSLWIHCFINCH